tara:strand:+ start:329 stop:646 length:318 start_codon:yes stop_codon:yes gene_type:complete
MAYFYLMGAILCEVTGTMLLPLSKNFTKLYPTLGLTIAYILAFYFLTFAIKEIPIAIAYSSWAGVGIFLITIFGYLFYGQSMRWQSLVGLFLIALGVALVNTFKN